MPDTDVLTPDTTEASVDETLLVTEGDTEDTDSNEDTETQADDTRDFEAELEAARTTAREEARNELQAEELLKDHRQKQARANQYLAQEAATEIRKNMAFAATSVENGTMTAAQLLSQVSMENLAAGIGGRIAASVATKEVADTDQFQDGLIAETYKDWRIPSDLVKRKEQALATGNTGEFHRVRFEIQRRAFIENEVPEAAKKLTAAEMAKAQKAREVAAMQKGGNSTGPAKVSGSASRGRFTTMLAVDTAFDRGEISFDDVKAYNAQFMAGKLPYK